MKDLLERYLNQSEPVPVDSPLLTYAAKAQALYPLYSEEAEQINGLSRLMYTTAIISDIGELCYSHRFCFESEETALREHLDWHSRGFSLQELPKNWIACRGLTKGELVEGYPSDYCNDVIDWINSNFEPCRRVHSHLCSFVSDLCEATNRTAEEANHALAYLTKIGVII